MTDNRPPKSRRLFLTQITALAAGPMLPREVRGTSDGPRNVPCSACEECTSRFCKYKRQNPNNQR